MANARLRQVTVIGNIAYIPLTRGQTAIIDADDVPLVEEWNWTAVSRGDGKGYYAARNAYFGGGRAAVKCEYVRMHRALLNAQPEQMVDHINGDGLDNRKSNLRFATSAQNQQNMKLRSNNVSGFKGVSWSDAAKKWVATIRIDKKRHHLGVFITKEVASLAYQQAARANFGEYMRLK